MEVSPLSSASTSSLSTSRPWSSICKTFESNAWRKDLCSHCFRSREEHDQDVIAAGPPATTSSSIAAAAARATTARATGILTSQVESSGSNECQSATLESGPIISSSSSSCTVGSSSISSVTSNGTARYQSLLQPIRSYTQLLNWSQQSQPQPQPLSAVSSARPLTSPLPPPSSSSSSSTSPPPPSSLVDEKSCSVIFTSQQSQSQLQQQQPPEAVNQVNHHLLVDADAGGRQTCHAVPFSIVLTSLLINVFAVIVWFPCRRSSSRRLTTL